MKPDMHKPDNAIIAAAIAILKKRISRGNLLNSAHDVSHYLMLSLAQEEREIFRCLFLDHRHHLIAEEDLFYGSISSSFVHPREIVKRALAINAAALIVAHNHPSGVAEPSKADLKMTQEIKSACHLVEISLLDHFVVGCGETTSLAQLGHL